MVPPDPSKRPPAIWDPEEILVRKSLDRMLEGLQIIGADWRYLYVNAETVRQCRLPREALIGRRMMDVFPGIENTPLFQILEECMEQRESRAFENEFVHPGGQVGWFELVVEPCEPGLLVRSVEITERRVAERELREHASALERSNAALEQYAFVAAHDLRGPLRQIATYVQLIQQDLGDTASPVVSEHLQHVLKATSQLRGLVDDLLEYSTLGREVPAFEDVNLRTSADEAVKSLAGAPGADRVSLRIHSLLTVRSQPALARMLFRNLIENALKFSGEAESPEIVIDAVEETDRVVVRVRDNGVGVAPEFRERVFQLFQRGPHGNRFPGRGIGLAGCKRIMELHSGDIGVESAPGGGACFWLAFPRQRTQGREET